MTLNHWVEGSSPSQVTWRDGRVVDYSGLENRRTERYRGFESLSLRHKRCKSSYYEICTSFFISLRHHPLLQSESNFLYPLFYNCTNRYRTYFSTSAIIMPILSEPNSSPLPRKLQSGPKRIPFSSEQDFRAFKSVSKYTAVKFQIHCSGRKNPLLCARRYAIVRSPHTYVPIGLHERSLKPTHTYA